MFYAGIGARDTPLDILRFMTDFAGEMERRGFTLRSGGAKGADQAFQEGVITKAQIWLPWHRFEYEFQRKYNHDLMLIDPQDQAARESVDIYHPQPDNLSHAGKKMMRRNYRQVIGSHGEKDSSFIVCWTKGGVVRGGTGQALRIANAYNIPVFNLGKEGTLDTLKAFVGL